MSFLDNLENNLKALEGREEKSPEQAKQELARREAEKAGAKARAPFVEALRNSPFAGELLTECRAIARAQRVLVQMTWLGEMVRFDARDKRMELVPGAAGIEAVFAEAGEEKRRQAIDLAILKPAELAQEWLS